jgi:nucleoside-triphosphatase THEP1
MASSYRAVVIHSWIGGGKTSTARIVAKALRTRGYSVKGILSIRLSCGVSDGYNAEDLYTGEIYPLVRLSSSVEGTDWETYGNPVYSFSHLGFIKANNALQEAANKIAPGVVVFLDEFGKLEVKGEGIRLGFNSVVSSISRGGVVVVLCRSPLVPDVATLLRKTANEIGIFKAGDAESVVNFLIN